MNRTLGLDNGRPVLGPLSERNADGDLARLFAQPRRYGNPVRLANSEWGRRRRRVGVPVDSDQHVAALDAGYIGGTAFEDVEKVPALLALMVKGTESRIDRVLGQEPVGSLVVEDGMAAAELRQRFADPVLEPLKVHGEQGR